MSIFESARIYVDAQFQSPGVFIDSSGQEVVIDNWMDGYPTNSQCVVVEGPALKATDQTRLRYTPNWMEFVTLCVK